MPKNQQVANAVISFESDLYGALKNGGSINSTPGTGSATARASAAEAEHPIKPAIIGTGTDPQVAAALDFLQKAVRGVRSAPRVTGGGQRPASPDGGTCKRNAKL